MSIAKARTLMAKYQALSNAAQFIESHGEEGFSFEDEKFNNVYLREKKKIADKLNIEAMKFLYKYRKLGIQVNSEVNERY